MARKKKKKHHDEHMDESWLIPYADLMTLLLALFIVLFAMSSVDSVKFQQLSKAFNDIFTSGTGVMDFASPVESTGRSDSLNEAKLLDQGEVRKALGEKDYKELSDLQERVNEYIEKSNVKDKLGTSLTGEGLMISIRDNVLFESGSATVRPENRQIAKEIANLLVMDPPRSIVISGYTDDVPISNSEFSSNWVLSAMRSVSFLDVLLDNKNLNPEWFSTKGFGEYKPVASNKTADGRAKNRRVEILITPREQLNK